MDGDLFFGEEVSCGEEVSWFSRPVAYDKVFTVTSMSHW